MSKIPDFVQGIQMPNMKNKDSSPLDLMRPGNGTPWEDRGSTGVVGAYFKTVIKSLTSPALLMDHIRRPETTNDSASFAMISGVMWAIGIVLYNVYWLYRVLPTSTVYLDGADPTYYWLSTVVEIVGICAGIFAWLRFGPRLFRSLGATELKGAPPSLISNCFNYAMGPSILALIPVIGWILAILWILIDVMVAGKRRLFMKPTGAVINVIIITFIAVVIAVGPWVLFHFVWGGLLEMNGLEKRPEPKPHVAPSPRD